MDKRRGIYAVLLLLLVAVGVGSASAQGGVYYEWVYSTQTVGTVPKGGTVVCDFGVRPEIVDAASLQVRRLIGVFSACDAAGNLTCVSQECQVGTFTYLRNANPVPVVMGPNGLPEASESVQYYDAGPVLAFVHSAPAFVGQLTGLMAGSVVKGIVLWLLGIIFAMALVRVLREILADFLPGGDALGGEMGHEEQVSVTQAGYDGRE